MSTPAKDETTLELSPPRSETQPLLTSSDALSDIEINVEADDESPVETDHSPQRPNPWTIAWYIVLTITGLLLLAMIVKGFIDAGDIDVRFYSTTQSVKLLVDFGQMSHAV